MSIDPPTPPRPQQLLFFPISATCMVLHCAGLRRSECHSQLFSYCFLSSPGRRDTTQEQLFSRNASMNAKHVTVFTTLHQPLFLSLSTLEKHFQYQRGIMIFFFPYCSAPFFSLIFLSSFLSTWNRELLLSL